MFSEVKISNGKGSNGAAFRRVLIGAAALMLGVMLPSKASFAEIIGSGYNFDATQSSQGSIVVDYGPGSTGNWEEDEQGRRYKRNDSYVTSTWLDTPEGSFCFDENGYVYTNSLLERDGKLYYVKDDGAVMKDVELGTKGIAYVVDEEGVATPASQLSEYDEAAREIAASLIGDIINDSMTEEEKITAIFNFVKFYYMGYTANGPLEDAAESAVYGFRRKTGNCFEYAAVSHYLILAAGFDDIIVKKFDDGHFWNMILTSKGWKHYDTTPWDDFDAGPILLSPTKFIEDNYWTYFKFNVGEYPEAM
ncbi:MAG TPA: transglutaminase domain-containing protein [Candidatus Avilachnospira avistercoris]|nr:transglutaminase domain-containing protein [Candidatus Avilachnospira avistercoris]